MAGSMVTAAPDGNRLVHLDEPNNPWQFHRHPTLEVPDQRHALARGRHRDREGGEQGHARAQFAFGQACAAGSGIPRNIAEALKWLTLAVNSGYGSAADDELAALKAKASPAEIAEGRKLSGEWKQKAPE